MSHPHTAPLAGFCFAGMASLLVGALLCRGCTTPPATRAEWVEPEARPGAPVTRPAWPDYLAALLILAALVGWGVWVSTRPPS